MEDEEELSYVVGAAAGENMWSRILGGFGWPVAHELASYLELIVFG